MKLNHKEAWKELDRSETSDKPFDFYPRGRVELRKRNALIFCSPYLCTEEMKKIIIKKFGLTKENGIYSVRMIADGSAHYRSLMLDDSGEKKTFQYAEIQNLCSKYYIDGEN